jgi:hypothetical protein
LLTATKKDFKIERLNKSSKKSLINKREAVIRIRPYALFIHEAFHEHERHGQDTSKYPARLCY